ncbi:MAG: hemerythrin domain-containing protein [Burkholderiaceae bacterium]|nr:hemerythrin domain-containing protein [Burkholderiaceae bacterium]
MSTTARSSTRSTSAARNEVIGMLKDDHKRAKKAFRDFENLDNDEECARLVDQTCGELTVHAMLEEELFYPAIREAMRDGALIEEAEVEHTSAKSLIEQLGSLSPGEERYAATFTVLGEYLKHHIKEEESEIFPQLARAQIDWEGLCEAMNTRRSELMEQFVPEAAAEAGSRGERQRTPEAGDGRRTQTR